MALPKKNTDDPYGDIKVCHKAKLVWPGGGVSPLCAKKPRKINLKRETWTVNDRFVTCKKCLKKLD